MPQNDSPTQYRIPLPIPEIFSKLHLENRPLDLQELKQAKAKRLLLQNSVPAYESLEWELANHSWDELGVLPFADSQVPFFITSSGRLSLHAAMMLFDLCEQLPAQQPIRVLELGAGSGLFARLFLEVFLAVCEQEGVDYYQRLTYVVTDRSNQTVEDWQRRGVFEPHSEHVECVAFNVLDWQQNNHTQNAVIDQGEPFAAVFCNYFLDVLPASIVHKRGADIKELYIETELTVDDTVIQQYTHLSLEEIQHLAESDCYDERQKLAPLAPILDFSRSFKDELCSGVSQSVVYDWLQQQTVDRQYVVNHGAYQCLEKLKTRLAPQGFILMNDYGDIGCGHSENEYDSKRFGPTLALDINFPLLARMMEQIELTCEVPEIDSQLSLHPRLMTNPKNEVVIKSFHTRFSFELQSFFEEPLETARKYAKLGRYKDAYEHYQIAMERQLCDWFVVGEVAEFVRLQLADAQTALKLAQYAVSLNPWYSTWLWDILGDSLFGLGRYQDAHAAYEQALRINPKDSASLLRIACTFEQYKQYENALSAIAIALGNDPGRKQRQALLEKQGHILAMLP